MTIEKAMAPDEASAQKQWESPLPLRGGEAGTSSGINIEPGHSDDGWHVQPPIRLSDGTSLQLYKDGEALHAAFDAIKAAKRRVCLEVYIYRSDPTGRAFSELLAAKAREGVLVYVIYDGFGCLDSDSAMFEMMAKAGVRLSVFHPVKPWECRYSWRPFNRDHRKLLVIDDDTAGLGGLNLGGEYAGSWVVKSESAKQPWRDNAVGIRGPAARVLFEAFRRTWRYTQRGGKLDRASMFHDVESGEFGVLASSPTRKSPLRTLGHLLRSARSSILLTMSYFAPPDELIDELCRARRKRNVRVRLMLPGQCDVKPLMWAARSFYDTLLSYGVEVYEREGAILHAKTMCIDGEISILGSTNLDYRSIEYNLELSVIIRNRAFGCQLHDLFENDVRFAKRILPGEWRRRPMADRITQWAVNRARYLL